MQQFCLYLLVQNRAHHALPWQQTRLLEHDADVLAVMGERSAVERDLARVGLLELTATCCHRSPERRRRAASQRLVAT